MRPVVLLQLGRVSNLPTVWTNVLAGVALAGGGVPAARLLPLGLALSLFYVGGMYLNDAFDREVDARERPGRPIPAGAISARAVFLAGFAMMAGGVALLLWLGYATAAGTGWRAAAAGLALGAAIVLYDAWHKANPLSPVVMGLCRLLVYVTAGLAVAAVLPDRLYLAGVALLCYVVGLTYAARQENLNRIANLWPLAFLAVPFAVTLPAIGATASSLVIYLGFLGWVVYALSFLVVPARLRVPRAVISLIAGISLFDALIIAQQGEAALAWVAVGGFLLTLAFQRWIAGT